MNTKKPYTKPQVKSHGKLEQMTQAGNTARNVADLGTFSS